jgi:hypothetical protein
MSTHPPTGAQPITIGDAQPIATQLVDTWFACHDTYDPDFHIACVVVRIDLGHHQGGAKPRLMAVGKHWQPPEPLAFEATMRWAQTYAVAKDLYDVRPRLVAEVERLTENLAMLTFWAVAEQPAPGVRRAVKIRREWVWP